MASSPTPAVSLTSTRQEHLLRVLATVPDPWAARGVRHPFRAVIAVG